MKTVGVYEAKTHLARLLDEVEQGECITITRHGKPIARLSPAPDRHPPRSRAELIAVLDAFRANQKPLGVSIKELIDEGRRH